MAEINITSLDHAVNITAWRKDEEFAPYPEGARDKALVHCPTDSSFSFLISGHRYLFKRSSHRYPEQFWVEIIAYHLGCLIGVSVPPTFAAFDRKEGLSGALIEWFLFPQSGIQNYIAGGDYCQTYIQDFDRRKGRQHNFETVIKIFKDLQKQYSNFNENWIEYWAKAFVFDSLIGNTDRHQDNWGIIEKFTTAEEKMPNEVSIAPVFDNGTSMGYNIFPQKFKHYESIEALEKYYLKGWHHMKWSLNETAQISHGEMLKRLSEKYPETREIMLHCLRGLDFVIFEDILNKLIKLDIPVRLSSERATFVLKLIKFRCERLINELEKKPCVL